MVEALFRHKADFHIHARGDPQQIQRHTPKELILKAQQLGFTVLAITNKNVVTYSEKLARFAEEHGILLLPGVEARVSGKEVLIINHLGAIPRTFEELAELREANPEVFTIAPHPYYPQSKCLHDAIREHRDLFDAIEYCHFYLPGINWNNEKAERIADTLDKPIVATSDAHQMGQFGRNCTWIEASEKPTAMDIITAIREGDSSYESHPTNPLFFVWRIFLILTVKWNTPIRRKYRAWHDKRMGREPL